MTNNITNRQMFFIIFLTLTSYTTIELPKKMAQTAGRSSWIPILIMALIYAIVAVIITSLHNMYKGRALFEYSQEIVGKYAAYIIVTYYLVVSYIICIYLNVKLVKLLSSNFLSETPKTFMLLMGTILFTYVAYKGITNIARLFEIIGILSLSVTLILCMFMIFQGMPVNILPFFRASDLTEIPDIFKSLVVSFTGLGVLLMIPFTDKNKNAPRVAFFSLLFIGLFYVLIVESTTMILGMINTSTLNDALIEAIRIIDFPVIARTDVFYLIFGLTSLFAGTISFFTTSIEFSCRLFKTKRHITAISSGLFLFVFSIIGLKISDLSEMYGNIAPFLLVPTSIIVPVSLFIIASIKKHMNREKIN